MNMVLKSLFICQYIYGTVCNTTWAHYVLSKYTFSGNDHGHVRTMHTKPMCKTRSEYGTTWMGIIHIIYIHDGGISCSGNRGIFLIQWNKTYCVGKIGKMYWNSLWSSPDQSLWLLLWNPGCSLPWNPDIIYNITLKVLVMTIDAQWEGMGDARAGTTSPMPDHKGFKLQ